MIKINLGCGPRKKHKPAPWVNCDHAPFCAPDFLFDFGEEDWPFDNGCADEIEAKHCLEHVSGDGVQRVMMEAYRVLVPGGKFRIEVPHPRSDWFISDPTHRTPIVQGSLELFSRKLCLEWQERGISNTPLALQLDVDFEIVENEWIVSPEWQPRLLREDLTIIDEAKFREAVSTFNNVISGLNFVLVRV